ncbi:6-phosphofructo-2-kinase/fructose-2,6-biphosphatase [Wickerhamomyces ciferrii]|uniref:6-phosphofructo-2-kinase/fructose-2,6-biphosphatase n=1 Tax=Wickerhamomyces ciferrii (strain ATCC 14091 / BCRC 22168 / CBS 111 / JCM 3599 / NBRC 0793 / NRRL Y-1031 F-60-10) TaxID=1206466 RepID=K0KE09_WICCF|nr:6-phosphofructo-2-kinase/fructose-2,6-biphosphatase [Wickerhamomyces ciferrii]CCH41161.1 6-phosphofructo-2-kinase/fructose-2,6-biphosphatase [Wickerhamomyces ciferrii]
MVGLPARGKSYITKKVSNYLNWLNIQNKIFNVGNKRRLNLIDSNVGNTSNIKQNSDFFNPMEQSNVALRNQLALATLNDLLNWITQDDDHNVAIFDATNSTKSRRELIIQNIDSYMSNQDYTTEDYSICFLESICNDLDIIESNIKLKLNGPDYKNIDQTDALLDFKKRVLNYESIYESVSSQELISNHLQYLKIINIHNLQKFNINGIYSILLTNFLQHYNVTKKSIWLSINNLNFNQISSDLMINNSNLTIMSNDDQSSDCTSIIHKKIPKLHTLDQIHDLILDIESLSNDLLIQTQDQFLINGLFKYFKILQYSKDHSYSSFDLNNEIICINPNPYQVDLTKIEIQHQVQLPSLELSRSNNSSISSLNSNLLTPLQNFDEFGLGFKEFDMKNLNNELEERLRTII